jgi:hypothetical protein
MFSVDVNRAHGKFHDLRSSETFQKPRVMLLRPLASDVARTSVCSAGTPAGVLGFCLALLDPAGRECLRHGEVLSVH